MRPKKVVQGWRKCRLGNLFQIKHGYAFKSEYFSNNGPYILLTPGNFYEEGGFRLKGNQEKYYTGDFPLEYILKRGDLLIAMTEQAPGLLGSSILIPEGNLYLHNQRLGLVTNLNETEVSKKFLYHLFNFRCVRTQIHATASGTKVRHTSPSRIYSVEILLPPLPEQRKIAEILGAWDEAITLTERLIQARQRRKKALMQQLLTGKVRFGKFIQSEAKQETKFGELPTDWDIVHIEDVANVNIETLRENSDLDHTYFYIDLSSVDKGTILFPQERQRFGDLPSRARRVLHKHDVIMSTVRPYLLGFAVCDFEPRDVLCSTGFALISPKIPSDSNFIYQSLYGDAISRQAQALLVGSNYPAINSSDVKKLQLFWPKAIAEREKISNTLQTCDAEIDLLQQKLAALQWQKKGLMQQLLMGKVRVKVKDEG